MSKENRSTHTHTTKSFSKSWKKTKSLNSVSDVLFRGEGFDETGGLYLKFAVRGSKIDIPPIPVAEIISNPKTLFAELARAGWNAFTATSRNELLKKLENRAPRAPSFVVVTRLGWKGAAYVLPDEVIGKPKVPLERYFEDLDPAMLSKYRTRGALKDWQRITRLAEGNSRLMLSLSLAFTGPILKFTKGPKGGGFQIWGAAESGKTTAIMVAGSVWGCHKSEGRQERGFAESWNSTAGKIEVTGLTHNNVLLPLDETKRAGKTETEQAQTVVKAAFNLSEHTEKERLTNSRSPRDWRVYFLSTSNQSLLQLASRGRVHVDEADQGRLSDIPLPPGGQGIFEDLHDFKSGEKLADHLQGLCRRYFGVAGRKFVRKVVAMATTRSGRKELKRTLDKSRRTYLKGLKTAAAPEGLRPLNRTSGRAATCYAAGRLAIKFGILPWKPKVLLKTILRCQLDQLRVPDEIPSAATLQAKLTKFLKKEHGNFINIDKRKLKKGRDNPDDVPGFRTSSGGRWYLLTAKQLNQVIGAGPEVTALKQQLIRDGLMMPGKKGRSVVQRTIFKGGKGSKNCAWVHAISAQIRKSG